MESFFGRWCIRDASGCSHCGVRTFIAPTLEKVADGTEETLMNHFYQGLSTGQSRAEALRQAQLQLLKNPATSNFLQWGPVILSGDPGLAAQLVRPPK
ncbi:MAG: CHAT domain-containing protein [Terriglobia bacterium]